MTRKDYEKIAEILSSLLKDCELRQFEEDMEDRIEDYWFRIGNKNALHSVMLAFITHAKQDNPRFDAEKFLKACGY